MLSLYLDDVRNHLARNGKARVNLAEFAAQRPDIITPSLWLDVVRRATTAQPRQAMVRNLARTKLRFRIDGAPITRQSTKADLSRVWVERTDQPSPAKARSKKKKPTQQQGSR